MLRHLATPQSRCVFGVRMIRRKQFDTCEHLSFGADCADAPLFWRNLRAGAKEYSPGCRWWLPGMRWA
jgi:hypothetical protein